MQSRHTYTKLFVRCFLRIIGLFPLFLDINGNPIFSYLGLFFNLCLVFAYIFMSIIAFQKRMTLVLPKETVVAQIVDMIADGLENLNIISCLLVVAFRQKCLVKFYEKLKAIDLRLYDINVKHCKTFDINMNIISLGRKLTIVGISFFIICTVDHLRLLFDNYLLSIRFWIAYQSTKIVIYNLIIVFCETMIFFRKSFAKLNLLFQQSSSSYDKIQDIGQLHKILSELVDDFVGFYSFMVGSTIVHNFIHLSSNMYRIYLFLKFNGDWSLLDFLDFTSIMIWLNVKILILYFLCALPAAVSEEANKKSIFIHRMLKAVRENDLTSNNKRIARLLTILYQTNLEISVYGVFILDFKCFQSILTTSTMYIVFMIQLEHLK
ncbi:gustatory receptor 13 [Nasonia vitripennis]|uniref:Gustatory receptor n=1 Tax=Nasonia vitripennis TaxID=7425 RepID=A0A7M6UMK0_NASVI|nr:gustatory receptor 13 [Nasonia vitripennis]